MALMHNHARHKFHHQASFSSINFLFFCGCSVCGGILFNCTALKIHLCKTLQLYDRDFKIQWCENNKKCRLKSEFAFFQSLSLLFLPTYFVKCRQTLPKLNFKWPFLYPSSEREIKFRRCLFTSSINTK